MNIINPNYQDWKVEKIWSSRDFVANFNFKLNEHIYDPATTSFKLPINNITLVKSIDL